MAGVLKYIKDEPGQKTAVLIPVKVWADLNTNYKKLRQKLKVMNDIHSALHEVYDARKSGKKMKTLKEFLDQCSC
jgi:hypothetical protein